MLLLHLRQDVVAGAIEDAVDATKLIASERLAQRLNDGDAARHRGLELKSNTLLLGEPCQVSAVLGKERLVGGDDTLAGIERRLHCRLRSPALAADQLDEYIDRGVHSEPRRLIEP